MLNSDMRMLSCSMSLTFGFTFYYSMCDNMRSFHVSRLTVFRKEIQLFWYLSSILLRHRLFLSAKILINYRKGSFTLRSMKACLFPPISCPNLGHMREMCIPSLRQCILLSVGSWLFSVRMFFSPLPQNNARQIANVPGSPSWKTNSLCSQAWILMKLDTYSCVSIFECFRWINHQNS